MQDFTDKVAVITGGASGIGLAVGQALATRGAKLVLADIEPRVLDQAVAALRSDGADVIGIVTDVGDASAVDALAASSWRHFNAVDIVFNNAGVAVFGPIQDMTHADWEWSLRVNLWGPIHGVEAFVPRMIEQGTGGHVLFTASFAGLVPNRELAPYNVTKAAVIALAESLRKDVREHSIGVSVLCPMRVTTNIDLSSRNRPDALGGPGANRTYTDAERAALDGRLLAVEPVAEAVIDAMQRNNLYIHTHKEAEDYFRKRADRITAAFATAL
jgi:NAD(P)-dependent dehydrogenase (short-subunit alcohol dehydrogenase family)